MSQIWAVFYQYNAHASGSSIIMLCKITDIFTILGFVLIFRRVLSEMELVFSRNYIRIYVVFGDNT